VAFWENLLAELEALADHLAKRRSAIMQAWRVAIANDPALTTGDSIPRTELNDHVPAILSSFESRLRRVAARPTGSAAEGPLENAAAHGLHRWQQGYDLREVIRELGRLNECMVADLDAYARSAAAPATDVMATARAVWAATCTDGIADSATQFFQLQQLEASSMIGDLEHALQDIRELERQRAELWQQAAHDLRGNLGIVANATAGLRAAQASEAVRDTFLRLLQRNVHSLHHLLDDVTSLARLQAGDEMRQLAEVDVGALLTALCEDLVPYADQRRLYLRCEGPPQFVVQGDAVKIRRVVQNLALNALRYTEHGGVTVCWGDSDVGDGKRWALCVVDTGPGFHAGPGAPLAGALEEATALTNRPDANGAAAVPAQPAAPGPAPVQDARPVHQPPGEGIGLSIVKRLCDLLDATVEMTSDVDTGTTFRILIPRRYG
jgi:signal transduction histidine kinase